MKIRKPYRYWQNIENCRLEAKKFQTISDFAKYCKGGYHNARINGWVDDICSHMERRGNRKNKCIYSCEFSDNYVYVGLTYDFNNRRIEHLNLKRKKLSSIGKHIVKSQLTPKFKKITEYLPINEIILLENKYVNFYRKEGWFILNKIKTGGIGGSELKWTKENCQNEALKSNTRNDFRIKSSGAYDAAHKNNWLNEITIHMLKYRKYEGFWTKVNCQNEALKYKTRTNFARNSSGAYDSAHRNKWLNDVCKHM